MKQQKTPSKAVVFIKLTLMAIGLIIVLLDVVSGGSGGCGNNPHAYNASTRL